MSLHELGATSDHLKLTWYPGPLQALRLAGAMGGVLGGVESWGLGGASMRRAAFTARQASSRSTSFSSGSRFPVWFAVLRSMAFTSDGGRSGLTEGIRPATPDAKGTENDVPLALPSAPTTIPSSNPPPGISLTILTPGADTVTPAP